MSALSGITVSSDLAATFAGAAQTKSTRFLRVSIQNETLVHDLSLPINGSLEDDLSRLQDEDVVPTDTPSYILVKLDPPSADWMSIFYVPDSAKVRDKMLYASTRPLLLRSLGSNSFTDSIFATSKEDLTAESYAAHVRHNTAPNPLSSREKEMADLRLAENEVANYKGSGTRNSPIGTGVGLNWSQDVESALVELGHGSRRALVIVIDPQSETLILREAFDVELESIGSSLPQADPCYVFVALHHVNAQNNGREIVFIYSCPSGSPIKYRMLYSSGSTTTFQAAKTLLSSLDPPVKLATRKIETSDPMEVNEKFLIAEVGLSPAAYSSVNPPQVAFARPKGPPRRR